MHELWELLTSAQESIGGIPTKFLEQKREEIRQKKVGREMVFWGRQEGGRKGKRRGEEKGGWEVIGGQWQRKFYCRWFDFQVFSDVPVSLLDLLLALTLYLALLGKKTFALALFLYFTRRDCAWWHWPCVCLPSCVARECCQCCAGQTPLFHCLSFEFALSWEIVVRCCTVFEV